MIVPAYLGNILGDQNMPDCFKPSQIKPHENCNRVYWEIVETVWGHPNGSELTMFYWLNNKIVRLGQEHWHSCKFSHKKKYAWHKWWLLSIFS